MAAVFWAAMTVILAEVLSALGQLNRDWLLGGWLAFDAGLIGVAWASWRRRRTEVPLQFPSYGKFDAVLLGILGAYLCALAAVAWAAPPNNVDSLLYHMARVVHWAQQGSLVHYPTGYGHQLWFPPGAEILLMNVRLLVGDDRLAGFVQWFSFLGSLVGVWWIGRLIGLSRPGKWVAVSFAASIPMAVLQATSTQNDMVAAFWVVALSGLVINTLQRSLAAVEAFAVGAALGIGLLTKGTAYFACAPLVLWLILARPWRDRPRQSLVVLLLVGVIAILLNAGHGLRNLALGWTPVGPLDGDSLAQYPQGAIAALGSALLRPLQAALLNFATPSPELNSRIADGLAMLQKTLGVSIEGAALNWDWNHEDLAGSPVHFLVILGGILCVTVRQGWPKVGVTYAICLVAGYILLPIAVSQAVIPTSIRYQLTFLVTGSPLVGLVLGRHLKPRALTVVAYLFLLSALPWILFNKTRPVVAMRPGPGPGELPCLAGCTAVGSVFNSTKTDLLFANLQPRREGYMGMTQSLREKSCRDVGLRIDSHDP
ncbi:MAG TPA: glycosyltransferase family 39 protein, partial [Anaerolineae bacterium]|nr:glycosyltransferase family 39 protein [Anaerolineae bacterium]